MKIVRTKGFTLVELMVVVAIIVTIGALWLFEARHSRLNANDMAAVQTVRALAIAMELYAVKNGGAYPVDLDALVTAQPPYFYENICDGAPRRGYRYARSPMNGYTIEAIPEICGHTGSRHLTMEAGVQLTDTGCAG